MAVLAAWFLGCHTSRGSPSGPTKTPTLRLPTLGRVLARVHLPGPSVATSSHTQVSETSPEWPVFPALALSAATVCPKTGAKPLWVSLPPWLEEWAGGLAHPGGTRGWWQVRELLKVTAVFLLLVTRGMARGALSKPHAWPRFSVASQTGEDKD